LQSIVDRDNDNDSKLYITNYDKWAYGFYKKYFGGRPNIVSGVKQTNLIELAKKDVNFDNNKIKQLSVEFLNDEFAYLKSYQISKQDYLDNPRRGMGAEKRFGAFDKVCIWELFEAYNNLLAKKEMMDFNDVSIAIFDYMNSSNYYRQPFRNVIIDEAQDFSPIQMRVLSKLAANHISLFADGAQRIYQTGLSWKKLGVNIVGRSMELSKNYRNDSNIAFAASSILRNDIDKSEYTKIETTKMLGNKPLLVKANNMKEQLEFIAEEINKIDDYSKSVAILTRFKNLNKIISNSIRKNTRRNVSVISNGINSALLNDNSIKLSTLHSAKGLEFDYVFIVDISESSLSFIINKNQGIDSEEQIAREKRLLYTGMTRAKENVSMTYSGELPRILEDIDHNLLEHIDLVSDSFVPFNHKMIA